MFFTNHSQVLKKLLNICPVNFTPRLTTSHYDVPATYLYRSWNKAKTIGGYTMNINQPPVFVLINL